ncbi:MAG: GNAT family N-acetyltransferase [Eubacteriales bacterium]|nr:GNAT family N-acetyltransferase [Eubacteriales bacterium]
MDNLGDSCILVKPDTSMLAQIKDFRAAFLASGESMDGTGPLLRMEDPLEWLELNRQAERRENIPAEWVPFEQFVFLRERDGAIVGMIQFRFELNDFLRDFGGHIGYSVHPNERKKGYAKRMLAECLKVSKAYGLERVLLTCLVENEGSRRTIISCGGVYEKTVYCKRDDVYLERYWIEL